MSLIPHTTTNSGLHEFVADRVLSKFAAPGIRAVDLGSGPGAMAARLRALGCEVLAVDRSADGFEADVRHVANCGLYMATSVSATIDARVTLGLKRPK